MHLKDLVWKDNETQGKGPKPVPAPVATAHTPPPSMVPMEQYMYQANYQGNTQSEAYKTLSVKISFDNTDAGKLIQKYLHPLENVPLDPITKVKTAMAQAKEIDGLTLDKVLATFDGLKVSLQHESDSFNNTVAAAQTKEVDGRQTQITALSQDIAAKQAQLAQLSTEMTTIQAKLSQKKIEFTGAVQAKSAEIDQQKAHYQGILQ